MIADRVRAGASLRAIGRELGRPASTISREVSATVTRPGLSAAAPVGSYAPAPRHLFVAIATPKDWPTTNTVTPEQIHPGGRRPPTSWTPRALQPGGGAAGRRQGPGEGVGGFGADPDGRLRLLPSRGPLVSAPWPIAKHRGRYLPPRCRGGCCIKITSRSEGSGSIEAMASQDRVQGWQMPGRPHVSIGYEPHASGLTPVLQVTPIPT